MVPLLALLAIAAEPAEWEKAEAASLTNIRQVTKDFVRAGEGYFSPDGRAFVFQAEREADNPFYQIYMLSFETGDVHRVSNGVGKTTCAYFDPKNKRVIFASTHLDKDALAKQKQELDNRAAGKQRRYAWDYDETYDIPLEMGGMYWHLIDLIWIFLYPLLYLI